MSGVAPPNEGRKRTQQAEFLSGVPIVLGWLAGWLAGNPNILRQAVTVASVKTLEKPEYQANDSGTKSTIFWLKTCIETE